MAQPCQGGQQWAGDVLGLGADTDDAGADVGGGPDDGDVVELGPGPGDAAAVRCPAASPRDFHEPDGQPERNAVAGQLQDLVADGGLADLPGAPGGVVALFQFDGDPDGQLLVVPGMRGGERHPGRVGVGQGAPLELLQDHAAPVEHAG